MFTTRSPSTGSGSLEAPAFAKAMARLAESAEHVVFSEESGDADSSEVPAAFGEGWSILWGGQCAKIDSVSQILTAS